MNPRRWLEKLGLGAREALWPTQPVPPPRADGSYEALLAAVLGQLRATLEAMPGWTGARDAMAETRCTYGHTHVRFTATRTSPVAVGSDARVLAATRAVRDILRAYVDNGREGDGFRQARAIGDFMLEVEVRWIL